ncbi:P-loop ATPase, Sll1717 family [Cobetia marina]
MVLFPHEQARRGTEALVEGLMGAQNHRGKTWSSKACGPEIRFLIGPLPGTQKLSESLYHRALEWVSEWLSTVQNVRHESGLLELNEGEVTHWVPYREELAASQHVLDVQDVESLYGPVVDWVAGLLPLAKDEETGVPPLREKLTILDEVEIDAGTAEDQGSLLDVFIETDVVRRALDPRNPLVLGRKGTGKTALFRRIKEQHSDSHNVLAVMSPVADNFSSIHLSEALFKEIEGHLIHTDAMNWRQVWMTYLLVLACEQKYINKDFIESHLWDYPLPTNSVDLINWMKGLSSQSLYRLKLEDALQRFDEVLEKPLTLLWDGLDTQFGNEQADRQRRASALAGLISMVLEWERRFKQIRFKVLLREDIWREA